MKPQKKTSPLSCRWQRKAKGEFVELVFMVKASALGLAVSKTYGDNQPFDLVVTTASGRAYHVQVKSAWSFGYSRYTIPLVQLRRRSRLRPDFIVAYLPPHDLWYVIPVAEARKAHAIYLYPQKKNSRARFEKYRNAWRLITGNPADDTRSLGLTIHAQADPEFL